MAIPNFDISENIANYALENQYYNAHRQSSEIEYYERLEHIEQAKKEIEKSITKWDFVSINIEIKDGLHEGFQVILREKWQPQHHDTILKQFNNCFTNETFEGFLIEEKNNALKFIKDLAIKLQMGEVKGSEYVVYTDYDWLDSN